MSNDTIMTADTRAAFLKKAAVGGGAVLGSGAIMGMLPELASAKPSKKQDLAILNFALTLEFLEAAFYTEAAQAAGITGAAHDVANLLAKHETTHVKTLQSTIKALGGKPVKAPGVDFGNATQDQATFLSTALVLENTGVQAYLGQAGNLKNKKLLAAAASIVTVEARHAAAIAQLVGQDPFVDKAKTSITPFGAFDKPKSKGAILKAVEGTGFLKG